LAPRRGVLLSNDSEGERPPRCPDARGIKRAVVRQLDHALRCDSFISVVESLDLREGDHPSEVSALKAPRFRSVLVEREMRARTVVQR